MACNSCTGVQSVSEPYPRFRCFPRRNCACHEDFVAFFKLETANLPRSPTADKREFLKISQAVGFGFLIMGAIGYFIKLSKQLILQRDSLGSAPAACSSMSVRGGELSLMVSRSTYSCE
jgi:hypothetical protein